MRAPIPALLLTCTLVSQLLAPSAARADADYICTRFDRGECLEAEVLITPEQLLIPTEPVCLVCNDLELVDLEILREGLLDDILETIPKDWEASVRPTLDQAVEGVADSPNVPNLRLRYVGRARIDGPAKLGRLELRAPFGLPSGIRYVGRAFDRQTGRAVTNVGTLSLSADPQPQPARSRPLFLLGLLALALVVGVAWWYRSRRR